MASINLSNATTLELYQELSEILTVMEFDFSKLISPCTGKAKVWVSSCEEIGNGLKNAGRNSKFGYLVILITFR